VEDQGFIMSYKEICSLCKGNGYITVVVKGKDEIKQCWLCESQGETKYSQAEIDDFNKKGHKQVKAINEGKIVYERKRNQESDQGSRGSI
jgi:hypothetical protein